MNNRPLSEAEIRDMLLAASDDEEIVSELEDHISEDSELSSEDDETEIECTDCTYLSKDKLIQYRSDPPLQTRKRSSKDILNLTPGPTRYATSRIHDGLSVFRLFVTKDIEKIIIMNSNIEGARVFGDKWKEIDSVELSAYIGLLLLAGVFKSCNESTESLWNAETGRAIFRSTMSLQRFFHISRILRFDDRETRSYRREKDKFAAIRDLWDIWVEILPKLFNPSAYVTVDEQLVSFRGNCPFRQYMPKKPAKYGIKFWVLCDNETSYVWNIQPYTGRPTNQLREKNQGLRVVLDLSFGLKGHNITCDNFFSSYKLGQMLLKRNITMIGTMRKNKPSIPPELLQSKNKPVYSSTFVFTNDTMLVSYIPKRNKCVIVQSTLHSDKKVDTSECKKPQAILDYNSTKGAVDTLDKMISCYTCRRKTNRWPVVVFSNILDISAVNAYILFLAVNPDWKEKSYRRRRLFIEALGMALVQDHICRREVLPRQETAAKLVKSTQKQLKDNANSTPKSQDLDGINRKRGRCYLCKSDNKFQNACMMCGKYICKSHLRQVCTKCSATAAQ